MAELLCGEVGNEHILRSTVCLSNKTFVEALPYAKQYAYTFRWFKALALALIDIFLTATPAVPAGQKTEKIDLHKVSHTTSKGSELELKPWCPAFQARAPPCPGCLTGWGPVPEGPVLCLSLPGTPPWAAPSSHRLRATTTRWGVGARSGSAFTSLCALPCGR